MNKGRVVAVYSVIELVYIDYIIIYFMVIATKLLLWIPFDAAITIPNLVTLSSATKWGFLYYSNFPSLVAPLKLLITNSSTLTFHSFPSSIPFTTFHFMLSEFTHSILKYIHIYTPWVECFNLYYIYTLYVI